jgi:hypothetical protein
LAFASVVFEKALLFAGFYGMGYHITRAYAYSIAAWMQSMTDSDVVLIISLKLVYMIVARIDFQRREVRVTLDSKRQRDDWDVLGDVTLWKDTLLQSNVAFG